MVIQKSKGVTPTEELLSDLCERTFLGLWSYPNPFKDDQKELCDLLAVFEDHIFIFFDRESRKFDGPIKDISVTWNRWKKEAIDKQIKTANGAEKYIRSGRSVFLDQKNDAPFPIEIRQETKIHKIIVAHGAKEACEAFSDDNIYGSLAVSYGTPEDDSPYPFIVNLDGSDPVHILDSHNLEILFGELDTFRDLVSYFEEKERAIRRFDFLYYCGEEDLIAHYFTNFIEKRKAHCIGPDKDDVNGVTIGEGEWKYFVESESYSRRKSANSISYFWDSLIQHGCKHVLEGTMLGNADHKHGNSALHEMAKESRLSRRNLSELMLKAVQGFPFTGDEIARQLTYMTSYSDDKGFVFLQVSIPGVPDPAEARKAMLETACGAARNKFPHLKKVVGIAVDAPKLSNTTTEDFLLMDCSDWPNERREQYQNANEAFDFFQTKNLKQGENHISEFPVAGGAEPPNRKMGRNEPCWCGSGKKFKRCHINR